MARIYRQLVGVVIAESMGVKSFHLSTVRVEKQSGLCGSRLLRCEV